MLGILGRKVGMAQLFTEDGNVVPVTYVECAPNTIKQVKFAEKDQVDALVLGFESYKNPTKTKSHRVVRQLRGSADAQKGDSVEVSIFEEGEMVTIVGTSKGKGYTGQVKRHNFRVARKTHGTKDPRHGSTGACAMPGRTKPGIKMAGRHGNKRITLHKREVMRVDGSRHLLAIKGPIPGSTKGIVCIQKVS